MQVYEKEFATKVWNDIRSRELFQTYAQEIGSAGLSWESVDLQNKLMEYANHMYRIYTRGRHQRIDFSFNKMKWAPFTLDGAALFQNGDEQSEEISKYVNKYATVLALDIIERCTR